MSFLWLRGRTWFFRRAVPFRLRPTIGKKEVRISLKTGDAQLATRGAIAEAAKVDRMFAEAEAALTNPQVAVDRRLQEDAKKRAERERRGHPRTEEDEAAFNSYIDTGQRAILGHAGQGVADDYGVGFPIAVLAESMAKVTFPGLPGACLQKDLNEKGQPWFACLKDSGPKGVSGGCKSGERIPGGDMNHSRDSRLRLTLVTLAIAALALGAPDTSGAEKQKSLAERMYNDRVKRCKAMMRKDEMSRCDARSGTTYDEKLRGLHRTMMDRITKAQPADGTCSKYGATYLVCDEKMLGGKMMYTIYRLDRAKDGSDNYSMYVWSREY